MRDEPLLRVRGINKTFPGVAALRGVDLDVRAGEVHALMGENGAGKSTLIKIITGIHRCDGGGMFFAGEHIEPASAHEAQRLGISTIYQELNLIPYLTLSENIFIGREPKRFGFLRRDEMARRARDLFSEMGLRDIDVGAPLHTRSTAIQQMTAIARALSIQAKLMVMDEPTSSLDEGEVKLLFDVIRRVKSRGVAVLFISHRLDEIFDICDRVTILKDGELVGEYPIASITRYELVSRMIGRDASELDGEGRVRRSNADRPREILCRVRNASDGVKLKGVDLEIGKGEVVGLAGLLGSGRTELAKILFGDARLAEGAIEVGGREVRLRLPKTAIGLGMAYCSEDRKTEGIVPRLSLRDNITLAILPRLRGFGGFVSERRRDRVVAEYIGRLGIKATGPNQAMNTLSGGNQQKAILARWLCMKPDFIILDEPTRGIDVGAKAEIERIIRDLAGSGISILMISSELGELVRNCDRIAIMRDGEKTAELSGGDISEPSIMHAIAHGDGLAAKGTAP